MRSKKENQRILNTYHFDQSFSAIILIYFKVLAFHSATNGVFQNNLKFNEKGKNQIVTISCLRMYTREQRRLLTILTHLSVNENNSIDRNETSGKELALDYKQILIDERKKTTFDIKQLNYLLDGGQDVTLLKQKANKILEQDPILSQRYFGKTRDETLQLYVISNILVFIL